MASAFEIAIEDLDHEDVEMIKKYEVKMIEIESKEGFLAGISKPKLPNFTEIFNQEGQQGWSLVQVLTPEMAKGLWSGKTGNFVALLQREIVE